MSPKPTPSLQRIESESDAELLRRRWVLYALHQLIAREGFDTVAAQFELTKAQVQTLNGTSLS